MSNTPKKPNPDKLEVLLKPLLKEGDSMSFFITRIDSLRKELEGISEHYLTKDAYIKCLESALPRQPKRFGEVVNQVLTLSAGQPREELTEKQKKITPGT